jgi:L-2-hydroxyglutarate oxidase LhgO
VVATRQNQIEALEDLQQNALRNGAADIELLSTAEARRIVQDLYCVAVLSSPSTGIVDSHGLMKAPLGDFESAGGVVAFRSPVSAAIPNNGAVEVFVGDKEQTRIQARCLINVIGLEAPIVAGCIEGFPAKQVPTRCFAKGDYFSLSGKSPISWLIYPLPEPGGLGVRLALDLQGQARFGPDVEWIASPDCNVDERKREKFAESIWQYWPACDPETLQPAYAGSSRNWASLEHRLRIS